jgi:hypothetical protein
VTQVITQEVGVIVGTWTAEIAVAQTLEQATQKSTASTNLRQSRIIASLHRPAERGFLGFTSCHHRVDIVGWARLAQVQSQTSAREAWERTSTMACVKTNANQYLSEASAIRHLR